jgi:membrane protein
MSIIDSIGDLVATGQRWADDQQRRYAVLGFPFAVVKKYGDDGAGKQAALITYYGFLSLFPLLLLAVVVVTNVLAGNPQLRAQVLDQVVPPQFRVTIDHAVTNLPTTGLPLIIGIVGLLLSATGVVFTVSDTLNHLAGIPMRSRFGFFPRYLRVFLMVVIMIAALGAIAGLTVLAGEVSQIGSVSLVAAAIGSLLILFGLLLLATKILIAHPAPFRAVWPAAALGSVVIAVVLVVGGQVLTRFVTRSGPVYGSFATIVGVFALIYLVSQVLLYAAEIAVVRHRHLWPRALDSNRPTAADRVAFQILAQEQERTPQQQVTVEVTEVTEMTPKDAEQLALPGLS